MKGIILGSALTLAITWGTVIAQDASDFDWSSIPSTDNLTWVECYASPFQCTRLNVPMNYSNPDAGDFSLALIRIPSSLNTTDAYRGPVLYNPGGPGASGVDAMISGVGTQLVDIIGPEFDILSFDPRGIERSTPLIKFFQTDAENADWDWGPDSADPNARPDALPAQWAHFQLLGRLAESRDVNGTLPHYTTDNVARDMLRIVQLHGREKINYWGISYGTVLGSTYSAMFPDKIERLIIDGVLDMEGYYKTDWRNEIIDADKVLQGFIDGCFKAGPSACAFYANSSTAISERLTALESKVAAQPIVGFADTFPNYGVIDHAILRNSYFTSFYSPYTMFTLLAQGLADLETGNGTIIYQLGSIARIADSVAAVSCGDGIQVTDDAKALEAYNKEIAHLSSFASTVVGIRTLCSGWRVHPDNFKGPISGNTSFPLLIIGNTADHVTPLAMAKKTSKGFPGSVVLTQDSFGHTSFVASSKCTAGHVRQYFINGTLPAQGVVCPVETPLFGTQANISSRSLGDRIAVPGKRAVGNMARAPKSFKRLL